MNKLPQTAQEFANWQYQCQCQKHHIVSTRKVIIGQAALDQLPQALDELDLGSSYWLLADKNTHPAAGQQVQQLLERANLKFKTTILPGDKDGFIQADDVNLSAAQQGMWDQAQCFIGICSGVVNDLTRQLAYQFNKKYVAVATAASMNGYGSPISPILVKGTKQSLPAARTDLILADLDILAAAPIQLAQSGFGDLLAKNSSNADWFISGQVADSYYCQVPVMMVRAACDKCIAQAQQLPNGNIQAIETLIQGLIIGAFAMTAAGITAPASGAEHLISHYVEMHEHLHGRRPALHGQQVAIGTLIAAALYEQLLKFNPKDIDIDKLVSKHPDWPEYERKVHRAHGEMAPLIMEAAKAKFLTAPQYRDRLVRIKDLWGQMFDTIKPQLMSTDQIRQAYQSAGTPTKASDINMDGQIIRRALFNGTDLHARYTIFDLASQIGLLADVTDQVLDQAGVL